MANWTLAVRGEPVSRSTRCVEMSLMFPAVIAVTPEPGHWLRLTSETLYAEGFRSPCRAERRRRFRQ